MKDDLAAYNNINGLIAVLNIGHALKLLFLMKLMLNQQFYCFFLARMKPAYDNIKNLLSDFNYDQTNSKFVVTITLLLM